jgi:hypothetical protein
MKDIIITNEKKCPNCNQETSTGVIIKCPECGQGFCGLCFKPNYENDFTAKCPACSEVVNLAPLTELIPKE